MLASKSLGALSFTDPAWNIKYVKDLGSPKNYLSIQTQDSSPQDLFFKPDGTKMYVVGAVSRGVNEYNLSTAWNISTATYIQTFSVSAQETSPSGIFFKSDGTKMYVIGSSGDDVNEYDLSTAWDVSSASYVQNFSVAAQDTSPTGLFFKPDGTKMYVVGNTGDDINEYNLSTAWNISTASYVQNFSVAAQETFPSGIFFKSDGTKMYVLGNTGNDVNEYNLSSAWNISTASYFQNFSVAAQDPTPTGVFFKDDGSVMYMVGSDKDSVYQYQLSTAWDVSTASFSYPTNTFFSTLSVQPLCRGIFFKPDGTKMYTTGTSRDAVTEYDLSSAWDLTTVSYLQDFSVAAQDTSPTGLFFKPDGTKMYVLGGSGDDVNEYNLSTAWDVSSASYVQNFSHAGQSSNMYSLFFKPDGTKMYLSGFSIIYEYNLSSAWNISTASYVQSYTSGTSISASLFFKPDGTKMYVGNSTSDVLDEYNLSSAWNISTASYVQNFNLRPLCTNVTGMFFRDDGLKLYFVDVDLQGVYQFDLTT